MKILLTNDDGIDSLGIITLKAALSGIGDVTVVAPLFEQSAAGHGITIKRALRIVKYYKDDQFFGFAVDGTPADCVKLGINTIMRTPPDLVVSGINHGSNTATNIIYSGTVSAAREAAILGHHGIAFSINSREAANIDTLAPICAKITKKFHETGIRDGLTINVNFPDIPASKIKGILLTRQGNSRFEDEYELRFDHIGRESHQLTGILADLDAHDAKTDHYALMNNYISVTPIKLDLTDYDYLHELEKNNLGEIISQSN